MQSVLVEALFCKIFNWRIEFITGGIDIMPFDDLIEVVKNISLVYGEKVWLNLGVFTKTQLDQLKPYVKGIAASLETVHPELHKEMCPKKPLLPYTNMIENNLHDFKKSICIIVGLGDQDHIQYLLDYIKKHEIERITLYALKPIPGSGFTKGPSTDEYLQWMAQLRINFPKLEIIAGTNLRRCEEVGYYMKAGANAVTKFPATKQFGTKKAEYFTRLIEEQGREFTSNLTELPNVDWDEEIDKLPIIDKYKIAMKEKVQSYLKTFRNPKDQDPDIVITSNIT